MNKSTIIGLVIIGAILFGFSWWNTKQVEERQAIVKKEQARQDSIAALTAPKIAPIDSVAQKALADSLAAVAQAQMLGHLAPLATGTEEFITMENDLAIYTFSTKGGRIASVELKDYDRLNEADKGDKLVLFNPEGSQFSFEFFAPERIATGELYWVANKISDSQIAFRLSPDSTNYVEFIYILAKDNYMLDFKADFSHFRSAMSATQSDLTLRWNVVSPQEEKGFENENNYTTIAYKYPGVKGEFNELSVSTGTVEETIPTKVHWVAFKQQFFSSVIVAKEAFSTAALKYNTFEPSNSNIKDFNAQLTLPYNGTTDSYNFQFYFGPNKFSTLNAYGDEYGFQEIVPLGWWIIGWVNRWIVIPMFDFLSLYITNFGLIILILTLVIKLLLFPLTYKSYLSTAKMRLLAPEIKKINEKYPSKADAMKKQQATMGLYKSAGVSPMGGCLPMLIQFPFLIAMFRFFPSSIELRGQSFLWASDLSSYDSILSLPFNIPFYGSHVSLFTLLMAVSLYISSRLNYSQQSAMQTNAMPGMKFMMLYMMPLMLVLWFNNYSSGLSYYYLLSNLIAIAQTYIFRYVVSDEALHAKMQLAATKPVKKSKWAERLENMQKAQQAQLEQQQRAKSKKK
ncbi:MAG: membrane protein insertase YidC [Mucinivorans sp.]